jgi:hypothetical protein
MRNLDRFVLLLQKTLTVAKGYVQQPGVDFEEVFALVVWHETVHVMLAYVANEGWSVHHMDMNLAILNGDLVQDVFVSQPLGFIIKG